MPLSTSLSFVPSGPSSTLEHQRPFLRHAGTLHQFATGCIHHCPFNASLKTQLMSSFSCIAAHLAATGGTELTVNPKLRSHSWESVLKDLIILAIEGVVGSRDPERGLGPK